MKNPKMRKNVVNLQNDLKKSPIKIVMNDDENSNFNKNGHFESIYP